MNKQKIVLIEDDRVLSDAIYGGLSDAGFDVQRAFDGEEGLNLIAQKKPDLVLLDILMPKIGGLTVAKKLRSDSETKNIPIIILTVLDKAEPVAEAIEAGIYEYIVKADFTVDKIVKLVQAHFIGDDNSLIS